MPTAKMPQTPTETSSNSASVQRAQPWQQFWPAKKLTGQDISSGEVEGFKKGQEVVLGGVAGGFDKVLYDTNSKK